jgi:surface polysaccharide O-acyltransferase-like enzyme
VAKHAVVKLNASFIKTIEQASKCTLGIYLSHALVLNGFELMDINYNLLNPAISIPLMAIACFLISWLFIYILSKIPILKYVAG